MRYPPILLVEDNAADEALTLRAFMKNKILNHITVARDGTEALEHLFCDSSTGQELPALIILDLKLPKIDGFEVLRRIRADERTKLIPIVILTSSNEEEDILFGYEAGANAYVRKQVNFTDFVTTIGTLGLFWLLISEPPPEPGSLPGLAAAPAIPSP
jgi:two-component system response regulator